MRTTLRSSVWLSAVLLLTAVAGACRDPGPVVTEPMALAGCLAEDALAQAVAPSGMTGEGTAIVPIGRALTPVGRRVDVGYFPMGVALSPDGREAFVTHSGSGVLDVVDTVAGTVVQKLSDVGGFRGVLASPDGLRVYAAGAAAGTVSVLEKKHGHWVVAKTVKMAGSPTTLLAAPGFERVIAISSGNSKVWELDPEDLSIRSQYQAFGVFPYGAGVSPDGKLLLVSHVGSDSVTAVNRLTGALEAEVPVGMNPMGMAVDAKRNRVYVVNSDSDTLSVIELPKLAHPVTVDLTHSDEGYVGGSPNEVALSADGNLLYISFADLNRVEMWDVETWKRTAAIPTAHYPTGLALSGDGKLLAIANSKGWGGAVKLHSEPCPIQLVDLPLSDEVLAGLTEAADANVERTSKFWDASCPDPVPLPLDQAKEQVVTHVVLIVRENKTYDTVLGDFERGNGDPALTVFGEEFTPNLHAIAREFVNMDNYYVDSAESMQGHTWTTQADCNDYFEKIYPGDPAQIAFFGYDANAMLAESNFFDHCFDQGVSFRNYGEYESFAKDVFGLYHDFIDHKFPFYNTGIPDVWKAAEFIRELDLGIFPEFVYIAIPNDHTVGGKAGYPTPASMVADNDEATGMIVEAISQSPFWEQTVVFIIEDDPQGYGGDHVHSHRSICVAAGPWLRREYTTSVHYSIPALYRTIEMLLRLPPMHKNDAFASPMFDIFLSGEGDDLPDAAPFDAIARLIPEEVNPEAGEWAEWSERIDPTRPDGTDGLGYVIWRMMKGDEEPPPYAKWKDE